MQSKPWWKSKTIWFNILSVGLLFTPLAPLSPAVVGAVIASGNVVLRTITTQPITLTDTTSGSK
jgi:hypothetical protein